MRMCKLVSSKFNHIQDNKGFTLVEVLIAILLLAFISLQTFKMIDNSTTTKETVLKEDRLLLQTLTAISRIDSDFTQIYSPLYEYSKANPATDPNAIYQDSASSRGIFDGKAKNGAIIPQFQSEDKSTLVFFTAANRRKMADAKESRYAWVKYSIRSTDKKDLEPSETENSGGSELVRQTISANIFNSELNWNDAKHQVLLTHVKSVEFSFWDERTKKFVPSLLELNENKNIIRSIKLNLVWVDENNHEQKIEKVYRILHPYFNTKLDDMKASPTGPSGAYGDGTPVPGTPDPTNIGGQGQGQTPGTAGSQGAASGIHR